MRVTQRGLPRGRHRHGGRRSATGGHSTVWPHATAARKTRLATEPEGATMPAGARPGPSTFPRIRAPRRAIPAMDSHSAVPIPGPGGSETRYAAVGAPTAARPNADRHTHCMKVRADGCAKCAASGAHQPARGIARRRVSACRCRASLRGFRAAAEPRCRLLAGSLSPLSRARPRSCHAQRPVKRTGRSAP